MRVHPEILLQDSRLKFTPSVNSLFAQTFPPSDVQRIHSFKTRKTAAEAGDKGSRLISCWISKTLTKHSHRSASLPSGRASAW